MQLTVQTTDDQTERLSRLQTLGVQWLAPLAQAFSSGALEVLGRAVKNRFTGKGPFPVSQNRLGVVTNLLRKSLRATAVQVNQSSGEISIGMGTNVSYFMSHEFGFEGKVQVRGHTRKAVADGPSTPRGKLSRSRINNLKNAKLVRGRSNYSLVKPHSRNVKTPARRPLGTEVNSPENAPLFKRKIDGVLTKLLGFTNA